MVHVTADPLGVQPALGDLGVRVRSHPVKIDSPQTEEPDFLNSFFLEDLDLVADKVASGECGEG